MFRLVLLSLFIFVFAYSQEIDCEQEKLDALNQIELIEKALHKDTCIKFQLKGKEVCKDLTTVKQEYNEALAKVVLKQGLISLGADLERSSKALTNISKEELNKAESIIENFENSLYNSQVLSLAITPDSEGNHIFKQFNYGQDDFSQEELSKKCQATKSDFCSQYLKLKSEQQESSYNVLFGFLRSYNHANFDNRDEDGLFKDFRKYLQIKIKNKELSLDEYLDSEQIRKVSELKNLVRQFQISKNQDTAEEILLLSKNLEEISVPFNTGTDISNTEYIQKTAKDLIEKNYTELISAANILTNAESTKKHMRDTKKQLHADSGHLLNKINHLANSSFSSACAGLTLDACASLLEGSSEHDDKGGKELVAQYKSYKQYQKHMNALEASAICIEDEAKKVKKKECIDSVLADFQIDLTADLDQLKQDLQDKEFVLKKISEVSEVHNLEKDKMKVVSRLYSLGCFNENNYECVKNSQNGSVQGILTLGDDLRSITTKFNIDKLEKYNVVFENKNNNNNNRNSNNNSNRNISSTKLTAEEERTLRKQQRVEKREKRINERYVRRQRNGGVTGGDTFTAGFSQVLLGNVPLLMNQMHERQQIRHWADYQKSYHDWYVDQARDYYTYYSDTGLYANWGHGSYNPLFGNQFNYDNLNLYYNNSYSYPQFTFSGNDTQNLVQSNTTGTTSSGFSYSF